MTSIRETGLLTLTLAWLAQLSTALTGLHVCHNVENYTVTSREQYEEPVEILTLAWCLQIPPRCPQTRTELRQRWRTKTEVKYKTVPICCEGYVMQELVGSGSADAKCVPHCKKRCRSGVCSAPNECTCDPGFQGQDCSYECPQGTWGQNCENECNCLREVGCNPANGKCQCPAGWTGPRCENKCADGQWGSGCNSICLCESPTARCHHESGECIEPDSGNGPIDVFEASGVAVNLLPGKSAGSSDYIDVVDFDKEASLPRVTENDPETPAVPGLPDEMTVRRGESPSPATKPIEEDRRAVSQRSTTPLPAAGRPTTTEGNQLSQPDSPKKSGFDFDERRTNFRVIVSPKTDYVKTTHKGGAGASFSSIPTDVAAMIVVGALVSIGLTSIAALMIFHIRSRLLKAALSMYSQEKAERQYAEKDGAKGGGGGLDVTIGTLPRTMTRINPMYGTGSDAGSAVLTFDERPVEYANGTVTIGIRLSSNLRDLLESHYDKPASCAQRSSASPGEAVEPEHVYAEIPHASPFYFGKYT